MSPAFHLPLRARGAGGSHARGTAVCPGPEGLRRLTQLVQSPDYGFGFGVGKDALGGGAGHSGGFSGISSNLDIYLDTGWTVVVLSNVDGGMPPVAQKLREVAGRIR